MRTISRQIRERRRLAGNLLASLRSPTQSSTVVHSFVSALTYRRPCRTMHPPGGSTGFASSAAGVCANRWARAQQASGSCLFYILLLFFIQLYHFVGTWHLAYQPIRLTCPTCPTCPTQRASDKPRGLEYMQYHWCNFAQIYMQ